VIARLRRAHRADDGFSLTEVMVTALLVSILMTFVLTTTTRLYGASTDNDVRTTSLNNAQVGMDALTRQVRQAVYNADAGVQTRYAEATSGRLTVFAATADSPETVGGPRKVTFSVQGGRLVQDTVLPDPPATTSTTTSEITADNSYTYTRNTATRRVLLTGLRNPAAMFRYVLDDGTTVASAPDAATRTRVRGVVITLTVLTNPNRAIAPAVLVNTVYPLNREG
jgi:prepilin-type N-terminal cleavage/methylation domain-containing protein